MDKDQVGEATSMGKVLGSGEVEEVRVWDRESRHVELWGTCERSWSG
jgi:hypothetical protein